MKTSDPNETIRALVERWCDRREYAALAALLPAWVANNGLTDGWGDLRNAVRDAYASQRDRLPDQELETLRDVERALDVTLRGR